MTKRIIRTFTAVALTAAALTTVAATGHARTARATVHVGTAATSSIIVNGITRVSRGKHPDCPGHFHGSCP
jgi:hypothetical protein